MSNELHYKKKGLVHGLLGITETQDAECKCYSWGLVTLREEVPRSGSSPGGVSSRKDDL